MPRSELNSQFRDILTEAQAQGWDISKTARMHWRFKPPAMGDIVIFSGSPGDHRAIKNCVAKLRRGGLKLK